MLRWAAVLGIVGFVCGFVGPMILAPGANLGPLLGLFISGPVGALLGAFLGWVVGMLKLSPPVATRSLQVVATAMGAATLYFCIPPPSERADIVDAEIRRCIPPGSMRKEAVDRLNTIAAAHPPLPKPIQWGDAFDQALARNTGVVVEMHVFRRSKLYEHQAVWNRGSLVVKPWLPADEEAKFFASYRGKDCADYPPGARSLLALTGHVLIWPPAYVAEMLGLKVVDPLSAEIANLLK